MRQLSGVSEGEAVGDVEKEMLAVLDALTVTLPERVGDAVSVEDGATLFPKDCVRDDVGEMEALLEPLRVSDFVRDGEADADGVTDAVTQELRMTEPSPPRAGWPTAPPT